MTGNDTVTDATANVADVANTGAVVADTAQKNVTPSEGGDDGKPVVDANDTTTQAKEGEGETKPEGEGAADTADAEGAPEAYADFTVPEGMTLEPETTNAFKELAKSSNLSQASAQKLVDLASGLVDKTMQGLQAQMGERVAQWAEQAKADPVVGGPKFTENVQVALDAVTKFGDPELKQAFEEYGLGNHPAFIRAFYRIGKAMGESGFVHGLGNESPAKSGNPEVDLAKRMEAEQARNPVAKSYR
jgi:hypothetical protein